MLGQLFDNRHRPSTCDGLLNSAQLWYSTSCDAVITDEEEEEDATSSANQLGCTDVPRLSVIRSITSVLSVHFTADWYCIRMHCLLQDAVLVASFSDRCNVVKTCRVTGGQGHP